MAQLHLLSPWPWWVSGKYLNDRPNWFVEVGLHMSQAEREAHEAERNIFERHFEDDVSDPPLAAFSQLTRDAERAGFFETDIVDRFTDFIPRDAKAKPAWQKTLDNAFLEIVVAENYDAPLPTEPEARSEPIYAYLEALKVARDDSARAALALPIAQKALAKLKQRKAEKRPFYCWSVSTVEIEARIQVLTFVFHSQLGHAAEAFAAIRAAVNLASNGYRHAKLAWMMCFTYPQYREDAFDAAYRYGSFGRYEEIISLPEYVAFAARRDAEVASGKPSLRWSALTEPATEDEIATAEREIGRLFPEDYKEFLRDRGKTSLVLYKDEHRTELIFATAADLPVWGHVFHHWLDTMGDKEENYSQRWREQFGVDRAQLWSVATPWDNSRCLVISLADNSSWERCFVWDHDDPCDLVPIGDNFTEAVKAIETGFLTGAPEVMPLLD